MGATLASKKSGEPEHFIWYLPQELKTSEVDIIYGFRARQDPGMDPGPPVTISASGRHLIGRPTADHEGDDERMYSALRSDFMGPRTLAVLGAVSLCFCMMNIYSLIAHELLSFTSRSSPPSLWNTMPLLANRDCVSRIALDFRMGKIDALSMLMWNFGCSVCLVCYISV